MEPSPNWRSEVFALFGRFVLPLWRLPPYLPGGHGQARGPLQGGWAAGRHQIAFPPPILSAFHFLTIFGNPGVTGDAPR